MPGREDGVVPSGVVNIGTPENPNYVESTARVSAESYYRQFYDRNHEENNVYGGVYMWDNRQSMEDYLNSEFYDQVLTNNPNFVNISYIAYDVLDGPTSITNK